MGALEEKLASVQLVAHVTLNQKTTILTCTNNKINKKRRSYVIYKEKKGEILLNVSFSKSKIKCFSAIDII